MISRFGFFFNPGSKFSLTASNPNSIVFRIHAIVTWGGMPPTR